MKLEFKNIINKHKNVPAIVMGHGPSFNTHIHRLKSNKDNGFILFDCNNWYDFGHPPTEPTYWVISNTVFTMETRYKILNKFNIPIFYADTADLTDRKWVDENIKNDYLPYDNRHFDSKSHATTCGGGCCKHIIPGRLTIQEELQKYTNYKEHFSHGDSVAMFSLSFAILSGCNPIYIIGVDLDYKLGYAKATKHLDVSNRTVYDSASIRNNLLNDLRTINESAKNINVKLINLNKKSSFDVIEIGKIL